MAYVPFNIPPPLLKCGLEDMCTLVVKLRGEARREVKVKGK